MASITFLEAGTDATFDTGFYGNFVGAGNITSDSVTPHTGPRSVKIVSDGGSNTPSMGTPTGVVADAGARMTLYINFAAFTGGTSDVIQVQNAGGGTVWALQVTAGGVLGIHAGGFVKSGSTLSTGTWYRLTLVQVITAVNNYTIKAFVNGTLDSSATQADGNLSNSGSSRLQIGWISGTGVGTFNLDDLYIDDGATLDDPGDIRVTSKLPNANNTNNYNVAVGANPANRWTNVNERPLSETNGWEDTTAGGDQENYGLENAATGDVDLTGKTIVGWMAWLWGKVSVASVASKIMDNGSEFAITLTTSSALYTHPTTSASYPSNAAGIGARSSTTANTFLYECGTVIAYTTPAATGWGPLLSNRRNRLVLAGD